MGLECCQYKLLFVYLKNNCFQTLLDTMEATSVEHQDFFVPWHLPFHRAEIGGASAVAVASGFARKDEKKAAVVYNRYYHVFAKGELERYI